MWSVDAQECFVKAVRMGDRVVGVRDGRGRREREGGRGRWRERGKE